jgi:serpin B
MAQSLVVQSHRLVLDRPFLYVIHDVAHGTPLFVGRVADPS